MEFSYRSSPFRQIRTVTVRSAFHSTTAAEALAVRQITKGKNPPDISADIQRVPRSFYIREGTRSRIPSCDFPCVPEGFPGLGCRASAAAAMVPWISGAYSGAEPSRTDTAIPANTSDTPEWGSRVKPKHLCRIKQKSTTDVVLFPGGDDRDRTDYLLNAIQALSQVSYTPKVL